MSFADDIRGKISDVMGGAIGWVGDLATETFEKAARNIPADKRDGVQNLEKYSPEPADDPRSKGLTWDPYAIVNNMGYKDRPISLSYDTLELMARRVPIFTAIHHNRVNQVANFAIPQENDRDPGYKIKLRKEKKNPTKIERDEAESISDWLMWCGSTRKKGKDNFETFIKKTARDSLLYDQIAFEVIPNRKGLPSDFIAHDASTMRIADIPPGVNLQQDEKDEIRYVQVYDEVVIAEFTQEELCFGVRNPRTDLRVNGYGYSELEMIITTMTALLYGFDYNMRFFTQGSQPKGILNFKGTIPDSKLEAFRRHWHAMATGAIRSWRMPITSAEDVQYVSFQQSNRDMEWGNYIDLLIKITCAVCLMDPAELNFIYGNTGQSSQMFQSPAENRIKESKDRGLRPLLRCFQRWINEYLIWQINEDYHLVFTGIDDRSSDKVTDLQKKQVSYLKTVDEIRAEDDLPPLPDGKGEVILDSTWLQFAQAKDMEKEQQQQQEMGGTEGEGMPPDEEMGGEGMQEPTAQDLAGVPEPPPGMEVKVTEKSFKKSFPYTETIDL